MNIKEFNKGAIPGVRIGHLHLKVADLSDCESSTAQPEVPPCIRSVSEVFGLVPAEYRRAPRSCQHLTAEELNPAQEPETDQTDVEQVTPPISRSMVFFATSNIAAEHANVHCRYRKLAINFNTSMNRDPDSRVENP